MNAWPMLLMLALGLGACEGAETIDVGPGDDGDDAGGDTATTDDSEGEATDPDPDSDSATGVDHQGCRSMDLLFVIDDSASMAEEQGSLTAAFPAFVAILEDYFADATAGASYRVGVTTTSINRSFSLSVPGFPNTPMFSHGADGVLQGAGCGQGADPWLDGPRDDADTIFACQAGVPLEGTGYEMPFAAVQLALGPRSADGAPNAGFYRGGEDSLLVVVVITDEDDCSLAAGGVLGTTVGGICDPSRSTGLYEPAQTKAFLDELTGGDGRYVVVGIAGPGPGECSSALGEATEAKRLKQLVEAAGTHGVFGDLCAGDLAVALASAVATMQESCDDFPIE